MVSSPESNWVGIGLRSPYHSSFADAGDDPRIDWLEVHAENYFDRGGPRYRALSAIAARYPISVHGVALSLGSADGIDADQLDRLHALVSDVGACQVSEHLAWSRLGATYFNDLLPLPLTDDALDAVSRNVEHAQRHLGRRILIENPSTYLELPGASMREVMFLRRLVDRTGCGLLVDLNNLFVSANNVGTLWREWLDEIPTAAIGEIHLAGHEPDAHGGDLLIDTHGSDVSDDVWALYAELTRRIGPRPTIIERDCNWPPLEHLLGEADRASQIIGLVE
ncbi:hypothetical protein D9M73_72000 [compost metagenome]|jgi:uncharacterized protein (UPF0276 family)